MEGRFLQANQLFESALTRHKEFVEAISSSSATSTLCCGRLVANNHRCDDASNAVLASRDIDDDSNSSEFSDDDDDDKTISFVDDMRCYNQDQRQETTATNTHPPLIGIGCGGIRRMTTSSQLRTGSYCGQQQYQQQQQQQQPPSHQVFRLPIVMDKIEWNEASIAQQSFVLIFNAALCNHLLGMKLQVLMSKEQQGQQQEQGQDRTKQDTEDALTTTLCQQAFHVALMLYRLALENIGTTFATGVDKLHYVAIFNNISHVCKTTQGYHSHEAFRYDKLLLKSVYWLLDMDGLLVSSPAAATTTTSTVTATAGHRLIQPPLSQQEHGDSVHDQGIGTDVASITATTPTTPATNNMAITNHNNSTDISRRTAFYDDDDSQIIDAFMENVFYLIGAPDLLLAPAA